MFTKRRLFLSVCVVHFLLAHLSHDIIDFCSISALHLEPAPRLPRRLEQENREDSGQDAQPRLEGTLFFSDCEM